jgi:hypothetical protein
MDTGLRNGASMTTDTRSTPLDPAEAAAGAAKTATRISDWFRYQIRTALVARLDYVKLSQAEGRRLNNDLGASLFTAMGTDMAEPADHQATMTIPDPTQDPVGLRIPSAFYWRHR